jgi:hypothetical protein
MYRIINVVFTNRKLNAVEISKLPQYSFICNERVKEGDLLVSPNYSTGMMVTKIFTSESNLINGKIPIKELIVDTINGNLVETFKNNSNMTTKSNSMFNGIIDKYKSQFIPEKEEGVRMSLSGLICVPVGDEYIGMDSEGNLISFPVEMTIDIPVYSILKLNSDVKVGDIIKTAKSYSKVIGKNDDGLKILSFSGYTHNKKEVKDFLMNQATTRVLINMFNFDDSNGFNPIFFAMASGDNLDVNSLMMLSMTPQGKNLFSNTGGSFNPMMLMMLDKNNQDRSMMETMCMIQIMGGNNMFSNMFGNTSKLSNGDDELTELNRQIEIEQKKVELEKLRKQINSNEK